MKKIKQISLSAAAFLVCFSFSAVEACTHGTFLLPMSKGMIPVAGAVPIAIRHQNSEDGYSLRIYKAGEKCPYGNDNYTYKYTAYITQRLNDKPFYQGI